MDAANGVSGAVVVPDWQTLSIGQLLSWANIFLQYTDDVINALPEDEEVLDYRPVDPLGGYVFSIREQAMHIADKRHYILGQITGEEDDKDVFCLEYGGTERPWKWLAGVTRSQIIERHAAGRAKLNGWLAKTAPALIETSPRLEMLFAERNAELLASSSDITQRLAIGPQRVIDILFLIVAHEAGHRSVLQHLLRMGGHDTVRYA